MSDFFSTQSFLGWLDDLPLLTLYCKEYPVFRKQVLGEKHIPNQDCVGIGSAELSDDYIGFFKRSDDELVRTALVSADKTEVFEEDHRRGNQYPSVAKMLKRFEEYLTAIEAATVVSDARPEPVRLPQHEPVGATDVSESGQSPRRKGKNGQRVPLN